MFQAEPPDNGRLANLCGPLDANLRQLEDRLGVRLTRRDHRFELRGAPAARRRGIAVLERLYRLAATPIPSEEIELVIIEIIDADRRAESAARASAVRTAMAGTNTPMNTPPISPSTPETAPAPGQPPRRGAADPGPRPGAADEARAEAGPPIGADPVGADPVAEPANANHGSHPARGSRSAPANSGPSAADDPGSGGADPASWPPTAAPPHGQGERAAADRPPGALPAAEPAIVDDDENPAIVLRKAIIQGRTEHQRGYLRHILDHDITFGIGPAGTGKTYLAVACAAAALERDEVARIVLTRPAVEAGERLGYLPGDLAQKVDPYLRPLYDALYDLMGFDKVTRLFERQSIEIAPLAYMRGRTLNRSFIILDEAQNTTPEQMKMFLTRIGFGSKAVITGDVTQVDLPKNQQSGLVQAQQVLGGVRGIAFTRFTSQDVVRHPLVARIVDAYERHGDSGGR